VYPKEALPVIRSSVAFALLSVLALTAACASPTEEDAANSEDALVQRADHHYFYDGQLPVLENARVIASMKGHTAHVSGFVPAGVQVPDLPHVKKSVEGGRTKLDVVYPIATARPGKSNSRPGRYAFHEVKPYRPDGPAYTRQEGWHDVPWGGFPFFAYNGGIAFHGPITARDNAGTPDLQTWYLERGAVSGGCNRMLGEHVVELTHILGVNMRKVYDPNKAYRPTTTAAVTVISDYDTLDGKFIDVDYPTASGAVRPATVHGADKVVMFGSWINAEREDGADMPPNMKWEGGRSGDLYIFSEHGIRDQICSFAKSDLPKLKGLADRSGGALPPGVCAKKACVVSALRANADARTQCAL
jgi:hypothetical protein